MRVKLLLFQLICQSDKIGNTEFTHVNPSFNNSSELPSQDTLDFGPAFSNPSSYSTATIQQNDLTSFTTDNQLKWPPQPPSSQPLLALNTQPNHSQQLPTQTPAEDFVLFPQQTQPPSERQRATSHIALNNFPLGSPLAGHQTHRRRSTLFSTGRNPRVQKRVQSNGSRSASSSALHQFSHWSYTPPTSVSHQFHQHRTRPPVPLFSSPNTPENHHQNMNHRRNLSTSNIKDMENMFDLSPVGFGLGADDDLGLFNSEFTYFTSINSGGHEPGTVSPQELTFDHTSAPPSTTLTNFSTPSVFDTPDQTSSYETSPLFGPENSFGEESWPPLFPVQNDSSADDLKKLATISSMPKSSTAPVMMRKRSSPGQSPASTGGRHSSITGVNSRRRDKPLPPIRYDKGDPVALKRARNTEAARKSRARKVEKFEEMSKKIEDLEAEVDHWKSLYLNIQNGDTSALG